MVSALPVWKVRTRVLSLPSSTPGTQLAFLWARQHAQLQAITKHPPPPICRQQLFLTGVPLSTADGDQNGPVGRQHMVPPPAHAHALTDTQIGLFEVPCLWLQMQPGSSQNPIGFWDTSPHPRQPQSGTLQYLTDCESSGSLLWASRTHPLSW